MQTYDSLHNCHRLKGLMTFISIPFKKSQYQQCNAVQTNPTSYNKTTHRSLENAAKQHSPANLQQAHRRRHSMAFTKFCAFAPQSPYMSPASFRNKWVCRVLMSSQLVSPGLNPHKSLFRSSSFCSSKDLIKPGTLHCWQPSRISQSHPNPWEAAGS